MNTLTAALASAALASAALLVSGAAHAAVVTVDGTDYDLTTITGTADELRDQLEAQPFFGSLTQADDFAAALGQELGTPNDGNGPLFVFGLDGQSGPVIRARTVLGLFGGIGGFQSDALDRDFTFAVVDAAPVPLPAGLPLFLGGAAALGVMRRRAARPT